MKSKIKRNSQNITERILIGRLLLFFRKPERLSTKEYAEKYRWLTSDVSAMPGKMDCMRTPFMLFPMACMDNPHIRVIVGKKSAQISWSETQNSFIAKRIHIDPQSIIMAFPSFKKAKAYSNEKIKALIKSIPELLALIGNPDRCSFDFFKYPGGWLKLITAGSTEEVKSSSAPILIVEEPDGLKQDLKGQGDVLLNFIERQKTYADSKLIYAGTPTDKSFSNVDSAYEKSNQMVFMVPCHHCGEFHVLNFDNLICSPYPNNAINPTYGAHNPETALYYCPHCQKPWTDEDKENNVREAVKYNWIFNHPYIEHSLGWKETKEIDNKTLVGFSFKELMSSFAGSSLVNLARKKLEAEHELLTQGKEGKMKSFINNSDGEAYEIRIAGITPEQLKKKALNYKEMVVPVGGVVLTAGVDVQHNRFAIVVRAWGRNGNSWLVYWGEIFGNVLDPQDPVWQDLRDFLLKPIPYCLNNPKTGKPIQIPISAASIDSADGNVTELVYDFVKDITAVNPYIFAVRGSTDINYFAEIYTEPGTPEAETDKQKRKTLAETKGVNVFIMGAHRAHEEVLRKLALNGNKDRMYHYAEVREDYEKQLLSCVKQKSGDQKFRFILRPGQRKEAIDCEKMTLHASRAIQLHLWKEKHWQQAEKNLLITSALEQKPEETV